MKMKRIPENGKDVKELLCEQMGLLAEKSKVECEPSELCKLSEAMIQVSEHLRSFYNC